MKKFIALLTVAVVGCAASLTQAANIQVQPNFIGYLDPVTFAPVVSPTAGVPVVAQVDVFMNVVSLAAGEDSFGTAAFTVTHSGIGGATIIPSATAGGWAANPIPNVDSNGAAPGGLVPLFATNADLGADSQDYVGVLVQMATGAFTNAADPRRNVGEAGSSLGSPILLGSAFFLWNATGTATISLNPLEVSAKDTAGLYIAGTSPQVVPVVLTLGGEPTIPEPSTMVMAGLSLIGLAFRRRNG